MAGMQSEMQKGKGTSHSQHSCNSVVDSPLLNTAVSASESAITRGDTPPVAGSGGRHFPPRRSHQSSQHASPRLLHRSLNVAYTSVYPPVSSCYAQVSPFRCQNGSPLLLCSGVKIMETRHLRHGTEHRGAASVVRHQIRIESQPQLTPSCPCL